MEEDYNKRLRRDPGAHPQQRINPADIQQLPYQRETMERQLPTNPLDQVKKEIDDEHNERMSRIDEELAQHRESGDRARAQGEAADRDTMGIIQRKKEEELIRQEREHRGGESREEQARRFQGAGDRLRRSQEGRGTVYNVDREGRRTPRSVERGLTDVRTNLTHGLDDRRPAPQRFDGGAVRLMRDMYEASPDAEARRLGYASADDFIGARPEESADDLINRSLGEVQGKPETQRSEARGR